MDPSARDMNWVSRSYWSEPSCSASQPAARIARFAQADSACASSESAPIQPTKNRTVLRLFIARPLAIPLFYLKPRGLSHEGRPTAIRTLGCFSQTDISRLECNNLKLYGFYQNYITDSSIDTMRHILYNLHRSNTRPFWSLTELLMF
jgi:hypothetical protein